METNEIIEVIGNSAAYPMNFEYSGETKEGLPSINTKTAFGLTKREYYAALAMPVILKYSFDNKVHNGLFEAAAIDAVTASDALIQALDRKRQDKEILDNLEKE